MTSITRYKSDLLSSNMYIVTENGHAVIIDPFCSISPIGNLKIDYILLTHEHYDHISGVNHWKEQTGATVLCSKACAENIKDPKKNLSGYFMEFCKLQTWVKLDEFPDADLSFFCTADETFEDKMRFNWKSHEWNLFEMPGHSPGSIGILLDEKYFFSGDSLIDNCKIALRLPGGSRRKWEDIGAPRLANLPNGITVYPGHFDSFIYNKEPGR